MAGIGFFAPLPLALMMPFMAGQSMLMGDAFGKAYQYGKRKISAMSNEEFNKLTPQQLSQEIATDYTAMIPSLTTAIKNSSALQSMIIKELIEIARKLPADIVSGLTGTDSGTGINIQRGEGSTYEATDQFLSGITSFFTSLANALPAAHATSSNNAETFNLPNPDLENEPSDIQVTTATTAERKTKFINKIRSYSWKTLLAMNDYKTLSTEEKTWVRQFMATSEGQAKAPDIVHTGDTTSASAQEHLAWIQKRNEFITAVKTYSARMKNYLPTNSNHISAKLVVTQNLSYLRTLSNQYNSPNAAIGKDAIILRQWLSNWSQFGYFIKQN